MWMCNYLPEPEFSFYQHDISHLIQYSCRPFVHEKVAVMSVFAEECISCFQTGQVSEGGNVSKCATNDKSHLIYNTFRIKCFPQSSHTQKKLMRNITLIYTLVEMQPEITSLKSVWFVPSGGHFRVLSLRKLKYREKVCLLISLKL